MYLERLRALSAADCGMLQVPSRVTFVCGIVDFFGGGAQQCDAGVWRRESCRHVTALPNLMLNGAFQG